MYTKLGSDGGRMRETPQQEMVGRRGKTRNEIREDKPELETLNRLEKQADREPQPSGAV